MLLGDGRRSADAGLLADSRPARTQRGNGATFNAEGGRYKSQQDGGGTPFAGTRAGRRAAPFAKWKKKNPVEASLFHSPLCPTHSQPLLRYDALR